MWRLAGAIAMVRIAAFGVGVWAYQSPGSLQSIGYLLTLVGLPEIVLVRAWRFQTIPWVCLASAVLAAGSVLWAFLLRWVARAARKPTS